MIFQVLGQSLLNDIVDFLQFYFITNLKKISRSFFDQLDRAERQFGFKANLKNFWRPLFSDYSLPGYVFAVPFRLILIGLGLVVILFWLILYSLILLVYLFLPVVISIYLYYGRLS
ncbi:MAG: hypothetical protein M1505_01915 [Patescibacteria group bacterium]|nr:hypothetical protein [Patescibacteria group bacterium]